MIIVKGKNVTLSGELYELCKDATLMLSAITTVLRDKVDNPEEIYQDIVEYGRMDASEMEAYVKTHEAKEVPEWRRQKSSS